MGGLCCVRSVVQRNAYKILIPPDPTQEVFAMISWRPVMHLATRSNPGSCHVYGPWAARAGLLVARLLPLRSMAN